MQYTLAMDRETPPWHERPTGCIPQSCGWSTRRCAPPMARANGSAFAAIWQPTPAAAAILVGLDVDELSVGIANILAEGADPRHGVRGCERSGETGADMRRRRRGPGADRRGGLMPPV